jgi:RNA polymerase sigma-70 factor (ECF subfamily)
VPDTPIVSPLEIVSPEAVEASELGDIRRARSGDGAAFRRIVERHQREIGRMMWRFSRDPARHAELVQDVFVEAYMSLNGYRGHGPFAHWLRKIAVRAGLAHWRREKRNRHLPLDEAVASLASDEPDAHGAREAAEIVHRALAELPPRDRLVLTLLHLEERSIAEIAEMTGWSRAMVKVQAWRARNKMKRLLESAR